MPQGGVSRARRSTGCSGLLQPLGTAGIPSPWNADGACPSLQRQLDLVLLVPELTFLTGLSDLRKNSRMLKVRARLIPSSQLSRGFGRSLKPSLTPLGVPWCRT